MIGLIASAIGTAANMAANMMPTNKIVDSTKVYAPNSATFLNAGLFNNQVADLGMQQNFFNKEETSGTANLLKGIGSVASIAGPVLGGVEDYRKTNKEV